MQTTSTSISSTTRLEHAVQHSIQWIRTHQEQFWAISGTVAGAVFLIIFMMNRRETTNNDAWTQLGVAQGYVLQGHYEQAGKALDDWSTRFAGTDAATYAKFLRAD